MGSYSITDWYHVTSTLLFFLLLAFWFVDFGGLTHKLKHTRIGQFWHSKWTYRAVFITLCLTPLIFAEIQATFIEKQDIDNLVSTLQSTNQNIDSSGNSSSKDDIETILIENIERVLSDDEITSLTIIISTLLIASILPFPVFSIHSQSKSNKLLVSPFNVKPLFFPDYSNQIQRLFIMLFF